MDQIMSKIDGENAGIYSQSYQINYIPQKPTAPKLLQLYDE